MSEKRLKSCPFCGNNDRRVGIRRMGNKGYKVICGKCGGSGPYVAIKNWHDNKMIAQGQAIKGWNSRKPMEKIVQRLEECYDKKHEGYMISRDLIDLGRKYGLEESIEIVKEEGGLND